MSIVWISGLLLSGSMLVLAIISWIVLLIGRFRTWFIMPATDKDDRLKGRKWFIMQSFALLAGSFIILVRTWQKSEAHSDNVSENMIYLIAGLLLFRAVGEFKVMGLFRSEMHGDFTQIDRKLLTPLAIIMFLLCLPLI
jgi:hypothetical protein